MARDRAYAVRWKPWALLGLIALAWWFYAAPTHVAKRLRSAVERPADASIIAARVDFARVNAQLSGDLRKAANGGLDGASFSHLLRYGWLPRQRKQASAPVRAQQTRLYHIRYKALNRFMVTFWDAGEVHEVILTLQRRSVFHRWQVTRVAQYNVCAFDFDCPQVTIADLPARPAAD